MKFYLKLKNGKPEQDSQRQRKLELASQRLGGLPELDQVEIPSK